MTPAVETVKMTIVLPLMKCSRQMALAKIPISVISEKRSGARVRVGGFKSEVQRGYDTSVAAS